MRHDKVKSIETSVDIISYSHNKMGVIFVNRFWGNLSKFSILIVAVLFVIYSVGLIIEQPKDKYLFEIKMKELLGNHLEIINSTNKAEVQNSSFELPKNSNNIKQVINLLEKDGWAFKGEGIGIDTYCLGVNNRINIITPIWGGSYDLKGRRLNINNYSIYIVSYSYNKWGDDLCE